MTELSKKELRAILRQRRRSLLPEAQRRARQQMAKRAFTLPQWTHAQKIALYHGADGEIDTADIVQHCHKTGVQVYLPVMRPDRNLVFAQWAPTDELVQNSYGLFEPPAGASLCLVTNLDILFLPLVGWDKSGGRLGMGAGYYDRVLAGISGPLLVGLAHQIQEMKEIPMDSWDIPLDVIITDAALYHCQR